MESYWIVVDEVGIIQAEWYTNSIVEKEQHVQRYEGMPLIEYVQEITSILIFMEQKYMSGDDCREKKLGIFVGSDHKVSAEIIMFFPIGDGESLKIFKEGRDMLKGLPLRKARVDDGKGKVKTSQEIRTELK